MSNKEPTRHQLSSRLAYSAHTPAFLRRMQNRVSGQAEEEDDEYEDDGSGRPPIPRRPAIPERPDDDPGSADEDDGDEAPQIVVLKEGKHLSEREVENERRKAKGLPPLSEGDSKDLDKSDVPKEKAVEDKGKEQNKTQSQGLSFSSGSGSKPGNKKRKVLGDGEEDTEPKGKSKGPKKAKKAQKKLLSFGEDA